MPADRVANFVRGAEIRPLSSRRRSANRGGSVFIEVKVHCGCGARYKFDVEPVRGRMPASVQCPVCGLDGTESANAILHEKLAAPPAAAPVAEVEVIPPPPRKAGPAEAPQLPALPDATFGRAVPIEPDRPIQRPVQIAPGIAGGVVASALGGAGWFTLLTLTGFELGLMAWAAGALTGLASRTVARGGSRRLGWFAAVCVLVALAGGSCLATWRVSGAAPLGNIVTQSLGGWTPLWLLLAAVSASRLASR